MGKKLLILKLEGLLQSYGIQAPWEYRLSAYIPTKSAIIGMLGCAMGVPRNDKFFMKLDAQLKMAARVDRQGEMITDFQIIRGRLYTAEGKCYKSKGSNDEVTSKVTTRYYLQDAAFTVALEGEEDVLEKCYEALNNPVWPIYLGRKCCVPSCPVVGKKENSLVDTYESLDDLMLNYPLYSVLNPREDNEKKIMYQIEDPINGTEFNYDCTRSKVGDSYYPRYIRTVVSE